MIDSVSQMIEEEQMSDRALDVEQPRSQEPIASKNEQVRES